MLSSEQKGEIYGNLLAIFFLPVPTPLCHCVIATILTSEQLQRNAEFTL